MKKLEHKKELIDRHNLKDSADDFIQGSQDKLSLESSEKVYDQSEYLKKQFINRKKKLASFLPEKKDDSEENFTKLGAFKTNIGEVSVGYEKFKTNSRLRFTLLSNSEDDYDDENSKLDFKDKHNYFRKNYEEDKKYQENATTLEFDPKEKKLKKAHEVFSDNIETEDDELLYDDENENSQIEDIKKDPKLSNSVAAQRAISDLNDIKNEKKEDNHEFIRNLEEFSKLFRNNKLKEFEDSDELKTAHQRLSSKNMYYILRKRMEELKKAREKFYLVINSMLLKKIKAKKTKKKGVE
jgi:hypothetical protein